MSIIRGPKPESNFYLLSKDISEDARLSWAARGLLVYLLGKPDYWSVSITHLRNETKGSSKPTGRDGVYGLLDELISAGYVIRKQSREDGGLLGKYTYTVTESPLPGLPDTAQPLPAQPYTANPTLVSIDLQQELKEQVSTEKQASKKFDAISQRPGNVSEKTWADWCAFRKELKKPLTPTMCSMQAKTLSGLSESDADATLIKSMTNGWTGVFPEKPQAQPGISKHVGFGARDYKSGLTAKEDGTYDF